MSLNIISVMVFRMVTQCSYYEVESKYLKMIIVLALDNCRAAS
jgi:hypothetical protein